MMNLLALLIIAFAAWGQAVGWVTFHEQPTGVAAAAPLRDGSCGIFIGPLFWISPQLGAADWFPQAVMTHEVGHCLGHDHPAVWRESIMVPNIPAPNAADLALTPGPRWFDPWAYSLSIGGMAHD